MGLILTLRAAVDDRFSDKNDQDGFSVLLFELLLQMDFHIHFNHHIPK